MRPKLEKALVVSGRLGVKNTKFYSMIAEGLWTPPIHMGRHSFWPAHETDAIISARIAGKSDPEIRALVEQLVACRAQIHQVAA